MFKFVHISAVFTDQCHPLLSAAQEPRVAHSSPLRPFARDAVAQVPRIHVPSDGLTCHGRGLIRRTVIDVHVEQKVLAPPTAGHRQLTAMAPARMTLWRAHRC